MRGKRYATNIDEQMKIKGSKYRNYVSFVLKIWKNKSKGNYMISQTSRIVGMSKVSVYRALQESKFFTNHPERDKRASNKKSYEKQMLIKKSELRNRVALYLKTWRKFYSLKNSANSIGVAISAFGKIIMLSNMYKNQKKYSYSDSVFSLRWAKKLLAIKILGGKCNKCGTKDHFILEFHHVNKEHTICRMMSDGHMWTEIESEVNKCILLCRICHQKHHIDIEKVKRLNLLIQQKMQQIVTMKYKPIKKRKKRTCVALVP